MTAFSLISQSLRTGEPLHQVLPQSLVGRLLYHHYNHHNLHEASPDRAHGGDGITVETLSSLDYMFYATGIVAVFLVLKVKKFSKRPRRSLTLSIFFKSVDDLQKITRRLCGEVPFEGFEKWRSQFESAHATS